MPERRAAASPAVYDRDNRRFVVPSACPYPDCAREVEPANERHALAWCEHCQRPYEVVRFEPGGGAPAVELHRRPQSLYCNYTGQPLRNHSLLDWGEAGGGPERTFAVADGRNAIFGPPKAEVTIRLVAGWPPVNVLGELEDRYDYVTSMSVVRGQVVAATARGRFAIFDAESGRARLERPLEWPGLAPDPRKVDEAVRQPPAFRGTQAVLVAPRQALFRDLKNRLLGRRDEGSAGAPTPRPRLVDAGGRRRVFLGPPLGVDVADPGRIDPQAPAESFFCLLEGRPAAAAIEDATLRFFTLDGEQVAQCEAPAIARPPLFDRRLKRVVWVDCQGLVYSLPAEQLPAALAGGEKNLAVASCVPSEMLALAPSTRPLMAVSRDAGGRSELWLLAQDAEGRANFYRTALDPLFADPSAVWAWRVDPPPPGDLGRVQGFAIGASARGEDPTAQLLALATDRQVLSLQRANPTATSRHPLRASDYLADQGTKEPPLLSPAGIIARLPTGLYLDSQGLDWGGYRSKVAIPGAYDQPQGLAMFGRRIFAGHRRQVHCFELVPEPAGDGAEAGS